RTHSVVAQCGPNRIGYVHGPTLQGLESRTFLSPAPNVDTDSGHRAGGEERNAPTPRAIGGITHRHVQHDVEDARDDRRGGGHRDGDRDPSTTFVPRGVFEHE